MARFRVRSMRAPASQLALVAAVAMGGAPAAAQGVSEASPANTTAAQTEAPSPSSSAKPLPPLGPLEPGTYVDASTGSRFEFTVGEGWQLAEFRDSSRVGPGLADAEDERAQLFLTSFQGEVFSETCWNADNLDSYLFGAAFVQASPEGLIDHLAAHEFLTGEAVATEIAGQPGLQLDVSVEVADGCFPTVALWEIRPNWYHSISDDNEARFIATDTGNGTFVAFITAPADIYPDFLERAMAIVDSMSLAST